MNTRRMTKVRGAAVALLAGFLTACASQSVTDQKAADTFGALIMAHGGPPQWNQGVLSAVTPLQERYNLEVAFGMADATTIQAAIGRLEARGARHIGVVRLFISGESWDERTKQILGILPGAPPRPADTPSEHSAHDHEHSMAFWRVHSEASFTLSTRGLLESPDMGAVIADRARTLSRHPDREDVLILAHGAADDAENDRWIVQLNARADTVRKSLPFRRVQVETLREDWPEKRREAEQRVRAFVKRASDEQGTAIVIPFRVQGFGPYARVLDGLTYVSDGVGLVPHANVTRWIEQQMDALRAAQLWRAVVR